MDMIERFRNMNKRILAPFNVGDTIKFASKGSEYKKGTLTKVIAIRYDKSDYRSGKGVWRVKISICDGWWSATWFSKVKK